MNSKKGGGNEVGKLSDELNRCWRTDSSGKKFKEKVEEVLERWVKDCNNKDEINELFHWFTRFTILKERPKAEWLNTPKWFGELLFEKPRLFLGIVSKLERMDADNACFALSMATAKFKVNDQWCSLSGDEQLQHLLEAAHACSCDAGYFIKSVRLLCVFKGSEPDDDQLTEMMKTFEWRDSGGVDGALCYGDASKVEQAIEVAPKSVNAILQSKAGTILRKAFHRGDLKAAELIMRQYKGLRGAKSLKKQEWIACLRNGFNLLRPVDDTHSQNNVMVDLMDMCVAADPSGKTLMNAISNEVLTDAIKNGRLQQLVSVCGKCKHSWKLQRHLLQLLASIDVASNAQNVDKEDPFGEKLLNEARSQLGAGVNAKQERDRVWKKFLGELREAEPRNNTNVLTWPCANDESLKEPDRQCLLATLTRKFWRTVRNPAGKTLLTAALDASRCDDYKLALNILEQAQRLNLEDRRILLKRHPGLLVRAYKSGSKALLSSVLELYKDVDDLLLSELKGRWFRPGLWAAMIKEDFRSELASAVVKRCCDSGLSVDTFLKLLRVRDKSGLNVLQRMVKLDQKISENGAGILKSNARTILCCVLKKIGVTRDLIERAAFNKETKTLPPEYKVLYKPVRARVESLLPNIEDSNYAFGVIKGARTDRDMDNSPPEQNNVRCVLPNQY